MNEPKPFWKRKKLGLNIIAAIVVIAGFVGFTDFVPDPQVISFATVIGNVILRFMTKQPIGPTPA